MTHALTRYRDEKSLTLEAFGTLIGATKSQVWKWENGSIPRQSQMQRIIDVTDGKVTPNDWYATEAAE